MKQKYIPQDFEQKWTDVWDKEKLYSAGEIQDSPRKEKKYVLDMFPYPSGAGLHVGHPRGYVGSDILARFYRMQGYAVLHPMGWDAFGLPTENAAIKAKKNPKDITKDNIANFTRQLKMLGISYDWDKEFSTTDPSYYKWTQWLFIELFKLGLLYKKMTPVYYCPFCKTGIAQEEVLPNNTHERCQNEIEIRDLPQWIFRITSYADRLVDELDGLKWPAGILEMQRNWIGRKTGMKIEYPVKDSDETITVFTTRPETNFGATFIVLAPEHEFVKKITDGKKNDRAGDLISYVEQAKAKSEQDRIAEGKKKTGVFTGYSAINRLNNKEMPIYVSDFVLGNFGTGAVVGVPGHDKRDFDFAQAMNLEVIRVIKKEDELAITSKEQVYEGEGAVINSDFLNGLETKQATEKIVEYIEKQGWGKRHKTYHLRDWIFSRQRYWGEPIPMVFCETCAEQKIGYWSTDAGKTFLEKHQNVSKVDEEVQKNLFGWFPIDQKTLPLELPYLESYEPNESGESPLAKVEEWINTTCPNCGGHAKRESDTMPNWAGSCWYFIRFADSKNDIEAWSKKSLEWLPVDWYVGGAEHAVLHLLYSRFWAKALQDLGYINFNEPFLGLKNQGMILAEDHRKMSKSWGNVINPDDVVKEYGADALRVYEMFMAPFNQEIAWSTKSLQGTYRFVKRIWDIFQEDAYFVQTGEQEDAQLVKKLYKTIDKVSKDIPDVKYNTAVATMMEFLNEWEKNQGSASEKTNTDNSKRQYRKLSKENGKKFLKLVSPFASFTAEEIWRNVLGEKTSIHRSEWPQVDESQLVDDVVTVPVQINGKMRGTVTVSATQTQESYIISELKKDEKINKYIEGKEYRVIYIPGKIMNLIVK